MARYSAKHKEQTRQRLVESAVSTLRRDGVESAGLKEIMQELGLTVGGFYRHFPSKSALVQAAVTQGIEQSLDRMRTVSNDDGLESIARFSTLYLSDAHRRSLAGGCVLAALSSDIARGDSAVKAACQEGLRQIHKDVCDQLPDNAADVRERVWSIIALEVGGLLLSRMVDSDQIAAAILDSCRKSVRQLLEPNSPRRTQQAATAKQGRGRRPAVKSHGTRNR